MAVEVEQIFNRKHNVGTDSVMTLRVSNQVLCNVFSSNFYDFYNFYPLNNYDAIW